MDFLSSALLVGASVSGVGVSLLQVIFDLFRVPLLKPGPSVNEVVKLTSALNWQKFLSREGYKQSFPLREDKQVSVCLKYTM